MGYQAKRPTAPLAIVPSDNKACFVKWPRAPQDKANHSGLR